MRCFHDATVTMLQAGLRVGLALLLGVMGAGAASADAPGARGEGPHIRMTIEAESTRPAPGSSVTLALVHTPQPGWHGYWENPGDAGFPAKFAWTLPGGARVGAPAYPVPGRLIVADLMNYVYEHEYALLVPLSVPKGVAAGSVLPISVDRKSVV